MPDSLAIGDTLACIFKVGPQGNPISRAPDERLVVIDRQDPTIVEPGLPYVCQVRGRAQGREGDPGVRAYVVRIQRRLASDDYEVLHSTDLVKRQFTLRFRFPTYFGRLRYQTVDADVTQRLVERGAHEPIMELCLRYDRFQTTEEISFEETLRRGLPVNLFAPRAIPPLPLDPVLAHPNPRPVAGWRPTLYQHTGYLLAPTYRLAPAIQEAGQTIDNDALLRLARRRLSQILCLRAYDSLPCDSPDEATLEHALTALARIALMNSPDPQSRARLVVAEKRALTRRFQHQTGANLAASLTLVGIRCQYHASTRRFLVPLGAFLESTASFADGGWALNRQILDGGHVYLDTAQTRVLVQEAAARRLHQERAAPPRPDALVAALSVHAKATLTLLLQVPRPKPLAAPAPLTALPPCVAHALHKATDHSLAQAESYNAAAVLHAAGWDPVRVARMLTPAPSHETHRPRAQASLRPAPCAINRDLGICTWTCPNTTNPLDFLARHAHDPRLDAAVVSTSHATGSPSASAVTHGGAA